MELDEWIVLLDGKCLEAALPDVTAGIVVAVRASDVGGEQPLHPKSLGPCVASAKERNTRSESIKNE